MIRLWDTDGIKKSFVRDKYIKLNAHSYSVIIVLLV